MCVGEWGGGVVGCCLNFFFYLCVMFVGGTMMLPSFFSFLFYLFIYYFNFIFIFIIFIIFLFLLYIYILFFLGGQLINESYVSSR